MIITFLKNTVHNHSDLRCVNVWGEVRGRKVLAMTEQMITCREFSSRVCCALHAEQ